MKVLIFLHKYILPNTCFILSLFVITCFIIDRFNRAMNVMNNDFTKIVLLVFASLVLIDFIIRLILIGKNKENDKD